MKNTNLKQKSKEIERLNNLLRAKEGHLMLLRDSLKYKQEEVLMLKSKLGHGLSTKEQQEFLNFQAKIKKITGNKEKQINELKKIIIKQNNDLNELKNSVVYPFFLLTKRIGKTKIGGIVARLIKGK